MFKKIAKGTLSLCVLLSFLFFFAPGGSAQVLPENSPSVTAENKTLCLGGDLFGLRMETKGLLVTKIDEIQTLSALCSPGKDAGLKKGDVILKADGLNLDSAASFAKLLSRSGGRALSLQVLREKKEINLTLTPVQSADQSGYKAGIWVRDGAAGIGTVTFFDPESGKFAGLGHPVCDGETGVIYPFGSGSVCLAGVDKITKGTGGAPGEISGKLEKDPVGSLSGNLPTGVYGKVNSTCFQGEKISILPKGEIKPGKASVFCTLDSTGKQEYEIEIEEIVDQNRESKNFIIRVTDPKLIEKTGGIVQGMSGSPIVQNGHLIGAVTHVLVGDPTRGYGIFIENMLKALPE